LALYSLLPENTKQKCIHLEQTIGKYVEEVNLIRFLFCIFFGGLQCVGHSFAYVAHIREMSGFEPRELPQQAGTLPT
jgi:hypothetical protein